VVEFENKIVAIPLVVRFAVVLSVSKPAMYAVVIFSVIIAFAAVLLKIVIASPVEKIASGTVTDPPAPISMNSPTSLVAKV
jgi:hypothetical protein